MPVMGRLGLVTYRVPTFGPAGIEGEKLAPSPYAWLADVRKPHDKGDGAD